MENDPEPSEMIAERFLHPVGPGRFLEDFYTERCGRFRVDPSVDLHALVSMRSLEDQLRTPGIFEALSVAMRTPGAETATFVDRIADVYEGLSKGNALQIAHFERALSASHPLAKLFRALGEMCRAPGFGMTVFLSPPGASLPVHNDPFEIFTLQIDGSKVWNIHDFATPGTPVSALATTNQPNERFELSAGDVFYTPKGVVHEVLPGDGHALSVALIYDPPSWLGLTSELTRQLSAERQFWRSLPAAGLAGGAEDLRRQMHQAIDTMDFESFERSVEAQRQIAIPGNPARHLETALNVERIDTDTDVMVRPGPAPFLFEQNGETLLYSTHDTPIRIPQSGLDAIRYMLGCTGPFKVADVSATLSDGSKRALVRRLARRGLVQIARSN